MEENAEIELNGEEHVDESEEKKKKKRKLVKTRSSYKYIFIKIFTQILLIKLN